MNTHLLALQLMAAQGLLGAFDTLYHHELTEGLPQRQTARRELAIHAVRALIYSALFIGLSAWQWHGIWAVVLLAVFGIEVVLTLWDFVVEDQTRLLPASERVTHTILAINGGAFITLLILNVPAWYAQPSMLAWAPHGVLSAFLALCGVGVGLSGIRDAFAALRLRAIERTPQPKLHFGDHPEHILVTGATGFIGRQLVQALLADQHQVTIITRHPKRAAWNFDGKVRCIASMDELPAHTPIDVIINLAGAPVLGWRWTAARQRALRHSRIELTHSLVRWIAQAQTKPRLLLSASAIGFYGIQAQGDDCELCEDSPPQPIFMSQMCADWESAAGEATQYGVRVCCLRLGLVLGHGGVLPMMLLPIQLGLGGTLGSGRQWLSWIHIHDVLRGIAHLWQAPASGDQPAAMAYNFTAPQALPQREFSQIAATLLNRPCWLPTPALPLRLALGEQVDLLLEGQRVTPRRLTKQGFAFSFETLKLALRNLKDSLNNPVNPRELSQKT